MKIQRAGREHEKPLRELLRASPMPGWARLAFGREPDFFQGLGVQGKKNEVLVTMEGDRAFGMACRGIRPLWVNGERMDMGYLSGLRIDPKVRRTGLLARGYAALRKLHEANPVPAYLTTIIEDNTKARGLLTSGRAGLPHYLDDGRYVTYAINLNRRRRAYRSPFEIRRGDEAGMEPVLRFLAEVGKKKQFFPVIEAADFGSGYLRGLNLKDFRVALNGSGEIIGAAAAWDQNAFKQTIVAGYAAPVRLLRPLLDGILQLAGFRGLPPPGQRLESLYVAFPCIRGGDPQILRALLERIYADHQNSGHHFLLLGLHERDPLAAAVSPFLTFRYISRLYRVCWDDGLEFVNGLDPTKIPHLELATL